MQVGDVRIFKENGRRLRIDSIEEDCIKDTLLDATIYQSGMMLFTFNGKREIFLSMVEPIKSEVVQDDLKELLK